MQLTERLNLQQVQTTGILRDVQNRNIELEFESTRENFDSRARKCISDAVTLINLKKAGEDYKKNRLYFPRFQEFINAGTTKFEVELISVYRVSTDGSSISVKPGQASKPSPEELAKKQQEQENNYNAEDIFINYLRDPTNPVAIAWKSFTNKADAKDHIIELIQSGKSPDEIARELGNNMYENFITHLKKLVP
jgi:hypothetical protein|tara:strand:- start:375 stop:956 length:582 start_codon:yes stop_codon:yes gene_type:complete